MAEITTAMVKELREATGAGILETRNALKEAEGDFDRAVQLLRERGLAKAAKKADRTVNQGIVMSELEQHGHVGAMLELNCETDFVARNDQFQDLASRLVKLAVESGSDSAEALLDKSLDGRSVKALLTESVATIGENIQLNMIHGRDVARIDRLIAQGLDLRHGSREALPEVRDARDGAGDVAAWFALVQVVGHRAVPRGST